MIWTSRASTSSWFPCTGAWIKHGCCLCMLLGHSFIFIFIFFSSVLKYSKLVFFFIGKIAEVQCGMTKDEQSFRNLSLSFRGAERQSPTVLQMALRFSRIMERQPDSMSGNTENRLKRVIEQFNVSPGLHVKHQVDSEKERIILNLLIGTCKDPPTAIITLKLYHFLGMKAWL